LLTSSQFNYISPKPPPSVLFVSLASIVTVEEVHGGERISKNDFQKSYPNKDNNGTEATKKKKKRLHLTEYGT
jgi:hypothetical protein